MNPIFTITYFIWFLTEILLNRLLRAKGTDRQQADKNSLSLIWVTIIAAVTAAVFISMKFYFPIVSNVGLNYIGLIVILAGIVLRFVAIVTLGRFFTVDVTIRPGHMLKKDGLYRYVRHPSYFASIISFIGFGLSLNNWVALLLIVVAIVVVFIIRINIEEKILTEQFGPEYIEYKKHTSRLIPFIY